MRPFRRPAIARPVLAAGVLLAVGALLTAASVTERHDLEVVFDGSSNVFDLQVAANADSSWTPRSADWTQGHDAPAQFVIDSDTAQGFAPGDIVGFRIAVKNASPTVAGAMTLAIDDPNPLGSALTSAGGFQELFDQLRFTVTDGGTTVIDGVSGSDLNRLRHTWAGVAPGDSRVLDVRVELPASTDNRWAAAATGIRFSWTGESE